MKLISHVNGDSDLIEAWLRYYLRLGVDSFHLIIHGDEGENQRLFDIKDSYPITIEDTYQGPFHIAEKARRLDWVLTRHTGQWVLLVDSDEFAELPYGDVSATIRELDRASANVMAAPMLQRLTIDGSLETPSVVDDPFKIFPLCSVDLYRKMGVQGDIFKFPLFFCASGTRLAEGGNHHPPLGHEPRSSNLRGVTHHFKFRRTVSQRFEKRIDSEHPWRHESVQFREYLARHGNHLPLEDAFVYSREELFRRGFLKQLFVSNVGLQQADGQRAAECREQGTSATKYSVEALEPGIVNAQHVSALEGERIMFVLPKADEFGGLERHLFGMLRKIGQTRCKPLIVCFDWDVITAKMDDDQLARVEVKCQKQPKSLREWLQLIRNARPGIIVFCYSWIEAFPWQAPVAALLAGVPRRFSIQHLIPPTSPPPIHGWSPRNVLRRLLGQRVRRLLGVRLSGYTFTRTICVSNAVREALVNCYGFLARTTITVLNGVSTSTFAPSKMHGLSVRTRLGIGSEEFLLVCACRLVEAKGIDVLLYSASRVLRQGISIKCIIVGEGPLREKLQREASSLGLTGYVFFEGFQKDVRPYLQAASAFILTSHIEGLPLSVLEAMACGLPCIVTDVGGNSEAVRNRVNGLVIPPGSVDEAENAILYLATHPSERAEMADHARRTACKDFDIETCTGKLAEVILS